MGYGSRAMDLLISYYQGAFNKGPGPRLGEFGGEGGDGLESFSTKQTSLSTTGLDEEEVKGV